MEIRHHSLRDPSQATTFPELVRSAASAYGDDPAIILKTADGELSSSFVEIERRSAQIACGLIARGVGKGTRIGFICGNGPLFATIFAAIARIGAIAVPVSTFIKSNELVRVLRQSDIAGLIVQRHLLESDYVERLYSAMPELLRADSGDLRLACAPFLRWIVSSGDDLPTAVRDFNWLILAAESVSEQLLMDIESEVHPTDQLMEIYTSGSMALPKGVKHNHGPTLFRTHFIRSKSAAARGAEVPATMPMFWVGGLMMTLLPNWEVGAITTCVESTSTNSRVSMGVVIAEDDIPTIPEGTTIWSLGMTETLGPYAYADEFRARGYSLSAPLDHIADGYEVRVVDEHGEAVSDGMRGEIQIRGYAVTPGLHKIERSEYFESDSFYRTGDMGVVDGNRIHFVGRNGDMIKTSNTNVSPAEVEFELQQLEEVHSAYVVGIPDPERGQLVVAAIVARDDFILNFDDIKHKLLQRLSVYKVPREYVAILRNEVPMLPSNKVARRRIEEMIIQKLRRS